MKYKIYLSFFLSKGNILFQANTNLKHLLYSLLFLKSNLNDKKIIHFQDCMIKINRKCFKYLKKLLLVHKI